MTPKPQTRKQTEKLTVLIPADLLQAAKAHALDKGTSVTALVTKGLEAVVPRRITLQVTYAQAPKGSK